MSSEPKPNLFVVGAPKCGTTFLHAGLAQHPRIFMSALKEPRFWSDDLREQGRAFHRDLRFRCLTSLRGVLALPLCLWSRRRARPDLNLGIDRLETYMSMFRDADPVRQPYIGESSADSMWSATAAKGIAAFCPDARIVIMLREPISYIVSSHREALSGRLGERVKSLQRALSLETERRAGRAVPCTARYPFSVCYRLQARFDDQVQRFLDVFDREQIHFMLLEDIALDSRAALDGVFSFLGLRAIASEFDLQPRNQGQPSPHSRLSSGWIERLREEFAPVVTRLESQSGLTLRSRWGYPG